MCHWNLAVRNLHTWLVCFERWDALLDLLLLFLWNPDGPLGAPLQVCGAVMGPRWSMTIRSVFPAWLAGREASATITTCAPPAPWETLEKKKAEAAAVAAAFPGIFPWRASHRGQEVHIWPWPCPRNSALCFYADKWPIGREMAEPS